MRTRHARSAHVANEHQERLITTEQEDKPIELKERGQMTYVSRMVTSGKGSHGEKLRARQRRHGRGAAVGKYGVLGRGSAQES